MVFSALISDDDGNRFNSVYYVFHTVSGDNPSGDVVKFHVDKPTSAVSVDINQEIIFTRSEHIDYSGNLADIVSLGENNNPKALDIDISISNNQYIIKHKPLEYNTDYSLTISDPEHKIRTQNIGNFSFHFHTAENSDNAQFLVIFMC